MEDRLTVSAGRAATALAALLAIILISAGFWALALWPLGAAAPDWVARTREICFGRTPDGLPHAGGWVLLVGEPAGMLLFLIAAWGHEVRAGFQMLWRGWPGRLAIGAAIVLLALVAVGGLVAATGAFAFIAIAVKSVFFGEPLGEVVRGRHQAGIPQGLTHPPTHAPNVDELNAALHAPGRGIFGPAPGTLALVGVFLLAFVLYYFVNWKVLSFVWKIG